MTSRLMIISIIVSILCTCNAFAISPEQLESELQAANAAFRQANEISETDSDQADAFYETSILHFEKIVDQGGIKNASLYYNLANAYLLKGDSAKAILNYRRAEKLGGLTPDLAKNLAFARSQRVDNIAPQPTSKILHTLFFWHYDMSIKIRFVLTCLFVGLFFVVLTLLVWLGKRASLIAPAVICLMLSTAFGVSVTVSAIDEKTNFQGVIVADSVLATQGPASNYLPSFKEPLHGGTEFDLIKKQPGYYYIQLQDGKSQGWIPQNTAELL